MAENPDELLTPVEAAKLLKVTRRTIYTWIHDGTLPAVKVGRRGWRIRRGDIPQPKRAEAA